MSTKTAQPTKTTVKKPTNGTAKGEKNGTDTKAKTATPVKSEVVKEEETTKSSVQQLVKERQQMRSKLDALYEDVEALENAQKQFDGIRSFGEISISIKGDGGQQFSTSRSDTVEAVMTAVKKSIDEKLAKANVQLAAFQF